MTEQIVAKVDALHTSEDFGRFQVEPLERGFGLTLGNALRRVLLSSLAGAAVTQVKVDGIYHEFATLPGVKEDTTELILNLKQLRLKSYTDQATQLRLIASGPGIVTASDLIYPSEIEIVNPELYVASLDSAEARLEMELTVEKGKGFRSSDGREPPSLGVIPVDAIFSPIRRVNYRVENTRVGERTDLDSLIIEIQTDGTISPMDALVQAATLLIEQFSVFTDLQAPRGRPDRGSLSTGSIPSHVLDMPIEQLDLSQRTYNCLKRSQITKVGQVMQMSEDELLSLRNFGQKSLEELRERLRQHGLLTEDADPSAELGAAAVAVGERDGGDDLVFDMSSDDDD
ncbi:MAG TPA: DNA-directed RNA polymerase subunit alpha [Chloroflexota bacterium]|nr:DNA-directed RNA polymerase subunit alpha [Chloroflexota bacterium]